MKHKNVEYRNHTNSGGNQSGHKKDVLWDCVIVANESHFGRRADWD